MREIRRGDTLLEDYRESNVTIHCKFKCQRIYIYLGADFSRDNVALYNINYSINKYYECLFIAII